MRVVATISGRLSRAALVPACVAMLAGCASQSTLSDRAAELAEAMPDGGLSTPTANQDVHAVVIPPAGWTAEPLKRSGRHAHQVWLSPTGHTAYGVIHFSLPLPLGDDILLWGFLREMQETEGEATLLDKAADPLTGGTRFVAEGGPYTIRTTLFSRGWNGWAVYVGTLREHTPQPDEVRLAERAREQTLEAMVE